MMLALVAITLVVALDIAFPPPLSRLDDLSPVVLDRDGRWVHGFTNQEGRWRLRADLGDIDPEFITHLIAIEDKRFYSHAGVDLRAVVRAGSSSARAGRIVSGASTITMQTARLLEPRPRNFGSKIVEMIRALQIERRLNKEEILSAYLSLAPYGGNIQGVRAASLIWFGKEPQYLTLAEQALLIALPQAPEARRPDRRAKAARQSRTAILNKLHQKGLIDDRQFAENREVGLPQSRSALPRAAWHLSHELTHSSDQTSSLVRTTLDLDMQKGAETLLSAYLAHNKDDATGALLIVENKTKQVRALVGSSGLDAKGGWNDLTRAIRSPGSTLKPFIYAMAFDDGVLSPGSVINDMPRSFGGYSPENFDRTFRGEVRIREALQHSLNVPAVMALEQVGADRFRAALSMTGAPLHTRARANTSNGLALALGGAGIDMRSLASLYAALADDGAVSPLVWYQDANAQSSKQRSYQLISKPVTEQITEILRKAPSLAGRLPAHLTTTAPEIAFKTGTSYGFRDAWAAGYSDDYTIIVWIGRADGAPRPGHTGRRTAAPLLFTLFDHVRENNPTLPLPDSAPVQEDTSMALARVRTIQVRPIVDSAAPRIVFPAPHVELFLPEENVIKPHHGYALVARGGLGELNWYVNGQKVKKDVVGNRPIWQPETAGFFDVTVIDEAGRSSAIKVRVSRAS